MRPNSAVKYPGLPVNIRNGSERFAEIKDERGAERLDPEYLAWVRRQPCIVGNGDCTKSLRRQAHHWPKRKKGSAWHDHSTCSLCARHHHEFHAIGCRPFENRHGLSVALKILEQRGRFLAEQKQ